MAIRNRYGKRAGKRSYKPRRRFTRRKVMSNAQLTRAIKRLPAPEVKQVRITYNNLTSFGIPDYNSVSWSLDNGVYTLNPTQNRLQIAQGTGQGNRVGNRIRTKSCYIKGVIFTQPQNPTYNPTPKPCEVLIYVFKIIGGGSNVDVSLTNFFQSGNTSISPTGSLADMTFPINKDKYRVLYKRIIKIGPADNTGSGSFAGAQYYANNDYKRNVTFYLPLTKYMDKVMRYSDTSLTVNNDTLYLAIIPLMCDGTTNTAGNFLLPVQCTMTQVYNFTDV